MSGNVSGCKIAISFTISRSGLTAFVIAGNGKSKAAIYAKTLISDLLLLWLSNFLDR